MIMQPPSRQYHAGSPTLGLQQPNTYDPSRPASNYQNQPNHIEYRPNELNPPMKDATITAMPTSSRAHPERNLIDGRQHESLRSNEITNKHKVFAVPPTKPYAGEKAAPYKNNQVGEIKPFNNNFQPNIN